MASLGSALQLHLMILRLKSMKHDLLNTSAKQRFTNAQSVLWEVLRWYHLFILRSKSTAKGHISWLARDISELKPRTVQIQQFKIDPTGIPDIRFEVICSKGTYIRSLAHEFGLLLDTRAHLAELKREAIGHFELSGAFDLDELVTLLRSPSEAEFEH